MDAAEVLQIVLLVVASVACGVVTWAVFDLVKTSRSTRSLVERIDATLIPLLDKADVTVDAVNAELLRIDEIVTRVEEVTERVSSTSRTVQEVANAPAEIVSEIADRVRKALRSRKHGSQGTAPVDSEHDVTAEPADNPSAPEPTQS